ncbi:hypothetical protein [Alkalicoccobacillus gibsonii]|uniref:hypothetical protein n=1 Tax=Alkalicoccobacillus gibsonii TaxID=79881 RepID=UPI001932BEAC|nr:hypothetical protein [Alkalicoccobacillus gibsonii]MBM0067729.1 hypothetical protein [Alkalicoccobacillus gibsonii]
MNQEPNVKPLYARPIHQEKPTGGRKAKQRPFASLPKPPQPKQQKPLKCCGQR